MRKFRVPVCPYCGRKVNPIRTWNLKLQGEYKCVQCHGISNIVLAPAVTILAAGAIIISILIFLFYRFFIGQITLSGILWMLLPYAVFFLASLFLVRLKRPIVKSNGKVVPSPRKRPPAPHARPERPEDMDHTRVL